MPIWTGGLAGGTIGIANSSELTGRVVRLLCEFTEKVDRNFKPIDLKNWLELVNL